MKKKNRYLDFLKKIVGREEQYGLLIDRLYEIEFYSVLPMDNNRLMDGRVLRDEYLMNERSLHGASHLPDFPCTVLEMMIGVARRLEFEVYGGPFDRPIGEWFWELVKNLELEWCDNESIEYDGYNLIDFAINQLVSREYKANGGGGLFPLRRKVPHGEGAGDQKRVEIWYQMNSWIMENFSLDRRVK